MSPDTGNTTLPTWYLFLRTRPEERPSVIKRCKAETKEAAAKVFAGQLNRLMDGEVFEESELLPAIKLENELTETDDQWIRTYAPELLEE